MSIEAKWTVYENNVQQYRVIFISSQAFLLTIGSIMYDKNCFLFTIIAAISLFHIWYLWFPVVKTRGRIVDYYKYQIGKTGNTQICSETEYVKERKKRKSTNSVLCIESNWRLTRIKLDMILPIIFSILWLGYLTVKFEILTIIVN